MPQQDPTLDFVAALNDPSKWIKVENIPICIPHERTVKNAAGEEQTIVVTADDLPEIANQLEERAAQYGVYPVMTYGHRQQSDPNFPEKDQPDIAGFTADHHFGYFGPSQVPAVLGTAYYKREEWEEAKKYPFRSMDYYPGTKKITGVALLKRDPYLPLGMVTYAMAAAGQNNGFIPSPVGHKDWRACMTHAMKTKPVTYGNLQRGDNQVGDQIFDGNNKVGEETQTGEDDKVDYGVVRTGLRVASKAADAAGSINPLIAVPNSIRHGDFAAASNPITATVNSAKRLVTGRGLMKKKSTTYQLEEPPVEYDESKLNFGFRSFQKSAATAVPKALSSSTPTAPPKPFNISGTSLDAVNKNPFDDAPKVPSIKPFNINGTSLDPVNRNPFDDAPKIGGSIPGKVGGAEGVGTGGAAGGELTGGQFFGGAAGALGGGYVGGEAGHGIAKTLGAGETGQLIGRRAGNVAGAVGGGILGSAIGGAVANSNSVGYTNMSEPQGHAQWKAMLDHAMKSKKCSGPAQYAVGIKTTLGATVGGLAGSAFGHPLAGAAIGAAAGNAGAFDTRDEPEAPTINTTNNFRGGQPVQSQNSKAPVIYALTSYRKK